MANHCHALALKCLRNAQIVIDFMCESEKRNSLHVRQFGLMYRIKKSLFCRRHRRHHLRHHRRRRCCLRRHVVCDQRKRLPVVNQFNIIFPSSFLLLLLLLKSSWSSSSLLAAVIAARAHSINKLNKCIYLVLFLEHISTHGILCTQELTAMAKGKAIRHSAVDTNFFNERRLYNSRSRCFLFSLSCESDCFRSFGVVRPSLSSVRSHVSREYALSRYYRVLKFTAVSVLFAFFFFVARRASSLTPQNERGDSKVTLVAV